MLATAGSGALNIDSIIKGAVSLKIGPSQTVNVPIDMKAVNKLIGIYPLITLKEAKEAVAAHKINGDFKVDHIKRALQKLTGETVVGEGQINHFLKLQINVWNRYKPEE